MGLMCSTMLALSAARRARRNARGPVIEAARPDRARARRLDTFYARAEVGRLQLYARSDLGRQVMGAPGLQHPLTVPLDYAQPTGDTITIGVLRKPASKPDKRIGCW